MSDVSINEQSLTLHAELRGKISVESKFDITNKQDLSKVYTPGVAAVCTEIEQNPSRVYDLTIKGNTVAVVTDGSAVLGLGNIGPEASLPVMEGKCMLFKKYANVDAFPLCLDSQDTDTIINTIRVLRPVLGGINLEDIAAPRCFEIEERLQDLGIPVFHDDQHGTAIVLLGALINAARLAGKKMSDLKVVINGAGAAGTAIANLLLCVGQDPNICEPVHDVVVCDTKGIIEIDRADIADNETKQRIVRVSNRSGLSGSLADAMRNADVFIGVSVAGVVTTGMVESMAEKPIIFAMANPIPEIMPEDAKMAGAFVVGTGRSDFPNQVNNVLAFPGIFRGALDARSPRITNRMKIAAAYALADYVADPTPDHVIPSPLDEKVAVAVAKAVAEAATIEQG